MPRKKKLFKQFPQVPHDHWKKRLEQDLKGAGTEKLLWETEDGIKLEPFYTSDNQDFIHNPSTQPGTFPFLRGWSGEKEGWKVRQKITASNVRDADRSLKLIKNGVDSISIVLEGELEEDDGKLHQFFIRLPLGDVEVNIFTKKPLQALTALIEAATEMGVKADSLHGLITPKDPGRIFRDGDGWNFSSAEADLYSEMIRKSSGYHNLRVIEVDVSPVSDSGSGSVRELAVALATGSEIMAEMSESGLKAGEIYNKIAFTFGTGSNWFLEVGKYRAARMLWSLVAKQYGAIDANLRPMYQHAITSRWNMTLYDRYVNLLRSQTEAMSAAIAGVNAITVLPYNSLVKQEDEIAERIARNQQLLLLEESYFGKVQDPGAGSYYIEEMTSKVASAAWEIFVEIESRGGLSASLADRYIEELVTESSRGKRRAVSAGKRRLLGTNVYPNPDEILSVADNGEEFSVTGKEFYTDRLADEVEELRLSTEKMKKRPVVFLVPMGNLAMRRARAQFSASFFGVAGYRVIDNPGFESAENAAREALEACADIIVLCSSDGEYPALAKELSGVQTGDALKVIAGDPAGLDELAGYGFDRFISRRSDLLETLSGYNEILKSRIK